MMDFGISAGVEGLLGGMTGAAGAYYGNQMASSATGEAQNWSQYMRATAYQTAVKDMRRAGLNPALMFGSGGAANTPGAPHQQVFAPDLSGMNIGRAVTSGLAVKTARDNAATVKAEREEAEARAKREGYLADAARFSEPTALNQLMNIVQERDRTNAETGRLRAGTENIDADTSWIRARDRSTRLGIPYSPEQIELIRQGPVGQGSRAIKEAVGNFLTSGKAIRQVLREQGPTKGDD